MFQHEIKIRVRYAETDQMGYVYYGNYATYFEVGRVESFRAIGFSYKELEAAGIGMPVLEYKTKYLAPAKYDDELTITVKISEMPGVRIRFEYEIRNEVGKTLNIAETTLVFINMETGRPTRLPEKFEALMHNYFRES
ncbi:MAG: acyl-CoA thioesterase [Cyclobacteriaceae bacterium]|nr:acyl-CoA thioesterase [Cyclobacteriaceae bacterium SS2]